jgi:hypothetical protein
MVTSQRLMERYDLHNTYCSMLGHRLDFSYCRTVSNGLPCRKVLDCWHELLPIREFINEHYSAKEQSIFLSPPPDKLSLLIELAEKAKR